MSDDSAHRLRAILAGETLEPPVTGLTFMPPEVLAPGSAEEAGSAMALAAFALSAGVDFAFVPSWEEWGADALRELVLAGVAGLWVVQGALWPALRIIGVTEGLQATAAQPEELVPMLNAALTGALAGVHAGLALGASAIVVAEDLAGAGGPLIAPDFATDEVFTRLRVLTQAAKRRDVPAMLHTDGDARAFFRPAVRAGFAALHGDFGGEGGLEQALRLSRPLGLTLAGGLATGALTDAARATLLGTSVSVEAAGGGLLISDDGGIQTQAQAASLLEALAAARR
jgi:hypothetical protein